MPVSPPKGGEGRRAAFFSNPLSDAAVLETGRKGRRTRGPSLFSGVPRLNEKKERARAARCQTVLEVAGCCYVSCSSFFFEGNPPKNGDNICSCFYVVGSNVKEERSSLPFLLFVFLFRRRWKGLFSSVSPPPPRATEGLLLGTLIGHFVVR